MSRPLDLLLLDGVIYAEHGRPPRQALGVRAGRVAALGTSAELREQTDGRTEVLDLAGRAVWPGLIDSHVHFLAWSLGHDQPQLDGLDTLDAALAEVAAGVARTEPGAWVIGRGWNKNLWGDFPTRHDLDRVAANHAVALFSKDGHALWVNSEALRRAGVDAGTADPEGGRLLREADGTPSGIALERAQGLLGRAIPPPDLERCLEALRRGVADAVAMGLTGLCELGTTGTPHPTLLAAYRTLEREAALPLRVWVGIPHGLLDQAAQLGVWSGLGSARLRVGPLKLFTDGALGPQTAWMLEPYEGTRDNVGIATLEPQALADVLRSANRVGLGVAMHAIGDRAVRMALDAVEQVWRDRPPLAGTPPPRIEHAQLVHPDDVPRFARLGIIPSMQPIHATSDMHMAERHWGARARHGYAWRSLKRSGATLAFGTDAPVEPLEPLRSLYAAVARRREDGEPAAGWYPEERLTLAEALEAYTLGSAIGLGARDELGGLAVGKRADLVVLNGDPLREPPEVLLQTRVDATLVDGELVFRRV